MKQIWEVKVTLTKSPKHNFTSPCWVCWSLMPEARLTSLKQFHNLQISVVINGEFCLSAFRGWFNTFSRSVLSPCSWFSEDSPSCQSSLLHLLSSLPWTLHIRTAPWTHFNSASSCSGNKVRVSTSRQSAEGHSSQSLYNFNSERLLCCVKTLPEFSSSFLRVRCLCFYLHIDLQCDLSAVWLNFLKLFMLVLSYVKQFTF